MNNRKRSSAEEVSARRDIGVDIILSRKAEKKEISEKTFKNEYKKRIQSLLNSNTSDSTIRRDIPYITIEVRKTIPDFEFHRIPLQKGAFQKKSDPTTITPLAYFESSITEIIALSSDNTIITLFDSHTNQFKNTDYVEKTVKSFPDNFRNDNHIILKIYFSSQSYAGIEQVVCDIYERTPKFSHINILSTKYYHRCAEIEFPGNELENIIKYTYLLFNRYWKKKKK